MSEPPAGVASGEANPAGSEKDHLETEPAALLRRELTRWRFENHEVVAPQLVGLLADSARFDDETAVALARRARQAYPLLDIWLAKALAGRDSQEMRRILVILSEIAQSNRILASLTPVFRTKDNVVRSKAALLFARFCENPNFAEQFRKAGDRRVLANAIEGFWGSRSPGARALMVAATEETDNRTMANAALGLHQLGDARGLAVLERMLGHGNEQYRASAAWAMGETGEKACLSLLESARDDPSDLVRRNVERSISTITG